jgi:hypothetical protein
MAEKDTGYGLLSQYGLDLGEERDVRTALRNQRIEQATKMNPVNYGDPRGEAFGRLGASVGNAVGERLGGGQQIPQEIQSRLNTVSSTKKAYADWERDNPDSKVPDRMEKYQEILADSAF